VKAKRAPWTLEVVPAEEVVDGEAFLRRYVEEVLEQVRREDATGPGDSSGTVRTLKSSRSATRSAVREGGPSEAPQTDGASDRSAGNA
jgi:hypothetical protein